MKINRFPVCYLSATVKNTNEIKQSVYKCNVLKQGKLKVKRQKKPYKVRLNSYW